MRSQTTVSARVNLFIGYLTKREVLLVLVCITLSGCYPEAAPFKATIAGFQIELPASASKLYQQGYRRVSRLSDAYEYSTDTTHIMWLMNYHDTREEPDRPKTRYTYGLVISLKNKGDQFEYVKRSLEKQFGKRFVPVVIRQAPISWAQQRPGYRLDLNSNTVLFIRKANTFSGDYWMEFNTIRIAIGYNLTQYQQEYFAITAYKTEEDD